MLKPFYRHARKTSTGLIVLLFSLSLWQLASAGWIQGKAIVAQQLLNTSWDKTLHEVDKVKTQNYKFQDIKTNKQKPWPWADTWPVAKLIVPKFNIEQIVLAGDAGNSLAFAPGHAMASAKLNTNGTAVISAHRDTHFTFLQDVKINDTFTLQTPGQTLQYQIYDLQVVNSDNYRLQNYSENKILVLVTCYPFNTITAGSSSRYLVFAQATNLI